MIYTSCLKNKNQDIKKRRATNLIISYPHQRVLARFFRANLGFFCASETARPKSSLEDNVRMQPDRDLVVPVYWPAGATQ